MNTKLGISTERPSELTNVIGASDDNQLMSTLEYHHGLGLVETDFVNFSHKRRDVAAFFSIRYVQNFGVKQ